MNSFKNNMHDNSAKGIKAVATILEKWGCSKSVQVTILGFDPDAYGDQTLSEEQQFRLSYILRIHGALRLQFDNPKNIYGFMSFKNQNKPFNGNRPLDLISTGNINDLKNICESIEALVLK